MRLGWNLLAGFTGSAWTALISVIATPFYLHFLGIESYGLIGFFTTLLTLVQLLDLGLSPTMNREVARHGSVVEVSRLSHLFRSLELLYWGVAMVLVVVLVLAAGWIGRHWLQSTHIAARDVLHAVMLMGVVAAVRWPIGLYSACLMGAQRLAVVSGLSIAMVTLGALGSILILAFVTPTIQAFFLWQAFVSMVHVALIRLLAWHVVGGRLGATFKIAELYRIWRFSAGVGAIAVTGVLLMQFDKVLLSKLVDLGAYGRYMLATLLASGLYMLATPMFNALYPRFSALVANGQTERLVELYSVTTRLLSTLAFALAFAVALHAAALIRLWTHNDALSVQVAPVASILIFAAALHCPLFLQYALQLAHGKARLALMLNVALLVIYVPLSILLTLASGGPGAASAWLVLQGIYLVSGTFFTHRQLLMGYAAHWLLRDIGIPFCASLVATCVVSRIEPHGVVGINGLIWTGVTIVLATSLSLAFSPDLRASLREILPMKQTKI